MSARTTIQLSRTLRSFRRTIHLGLAAAVLCIAATTAAQETVLKHDNDVASGKESINGGGHAIRFDAPGDGFMLTRVEVFGSRYGTPDAPPEKFEVQILDAQMNPIRTVYEPYSLFQRGSETWVALPIPSVAVPRTFWVCLDFNPTQTKGVYVSYHSSATESFSKMGSARYQFQDWPAAKNWMIRATVVAGGGAAAPAAPTAPAATAQPPATPAMMSASPAPGASGAPMIVSTNPPIGATNVDPALSEITITFDRDMKPSFSWTGGGPQFPKIPEGAKPVWRDKRTCALPVALQSGYTYRVGINAPSFKGFQSTEGVPIEPTAITFSTSGTPAAGAAQAAAPRIVGLSPANGAADVASATTELRVTFDVPMEAGCSWCGGGALFPTIPQGTKPVWSADKKTCTLPVQLRANWKYVLGLNSPSFQNFRSEAGIPLEPVAYQFTTGK